MNELEKCLDELLIFMSNEIENKAEPLYTVVFYFTENGEDLKNFKAITKIKNDELIKKALAKAKIEQYIKYLSQSYGDSQILLTENGFRKSKAIKLNRKENRKKLLSYPFEKIILPILIIIITAFITSHITSYIQNKNTNNEIEKLKKESEIQNKSITNELENIKKEIEWIKQNK